MDYQKRLKAKAISTKGKTKDLINKYKILNGAKYFYSEIFQNCLKNALNILVTLFDLIRGNLMKSN